MFRRFFQNLFGRKNVTGIANEPELGTDALNFAELNSLSRLKSMGSPLQSSLNNSEAMHRNNNMRSSVVRREAVLNRAQKTIGYSFTLTRNIRKHSKIAQKLCDSMLLGSILRMNIHRILGHRLAFIPISPSSLGQIPLNSLPKNGLVIVLSLLEELVSNCEEHLSHLIVLKNSGIQIGLQGEVNLSGLQPFMDIAEFILIDIGNNDLLAIKSQIDTINKQVSNKNLIATNIKTLDEFHICSMLPFHYFQGTFVSSMGKWSSPAMDVGRMKILSLLNLARQGEDDSELSKIFKQDPTLSFKILRYTNSAGFGRVTKITSIDQALFFLGRENLYRWLTMLLYTSGSGNELDLALLENALVRARLAELCAIDSLSKNECDEIFITGVFSLLDVLLRTPIEKVLDQVSLPPFVVEALLQKSGKYSPYLKLAIACEGTDQELVVTLSKQIGLKITQIMANQMDAMIWAEHANQ
jgi:EAL and modified HD-GYP domain-containing signal transduction protein